MIRHQDARTMARSLATYISDPDRIYRACKDEFRDPPSHRAIAEMRRRHVEEPFYHLDQSRNSRVSEHDPFKDSDDLAEASAALRKALIREHAFTLRILERRYGRQVVW